MVSVVKLVNPIQPYAWGSHTEIARLQGRHLPTDRPEAELWIGAHPVAPSKVVVGAACVPLPAWIRAHTSDVLGAASSAELPFLAKVLAAEQPLSLQVHPNAVQAREGFAREEAGGVPLTSPERCYRDPHPKVEAICALSRFVALWGFRPDDELDPLWAIRSRTLATAMQSLEAPPGERAAAVFRALLALGESDAERLARDVGEWATSQPSEAARWIRRIAEVHPRDPLALAPLLMNLVTLAPGEALEVYPNTLHAYLHGVGVEVMTPSDNVVRGGLTVKHVALDELDRLLDRRSVPPRVRFAPEPTASDPCEYRARHSLLRGRRDGARCRGVPGPLCVGRRERAHRAVHRRHPFALRAG
jgi:mannose-6-phosphate isomerase